MYQIVSNHLQWVNSDYIFKQEIERQTTICTCLQQPLDKEAAKVLLHPAMEIRDWYSGNIHFLFKNKNLAILVEFACEPFDHTSEIKPYKNGTIGTVGSYVKNYRVSLIRVSLISQSQRALILSTQLPELYTTNHSGETWSLTHHHHSWLHMHIKSFSQNIFIPTNHITCQCGTRTSLFQ